MIFVLFLPNFLVDALSFQMIGVYWNNHHLLKVAKTISAGGQKKMIDHIYISVSDVKKWNLKSGSIEAFRLARVRSVRLSYGPRRVYLTFTV